MIALIWLGWDGAKWAEICSSCGYLPSVNLLMGYRTLSIIMLPVARYY